MEKQKLKHLATALTNNQQILYFDDERELNQICRIVELREDGLTISNREYQYDVSFDDVKLISLPLSYLTKEIEHNGEKFVPYKYLKENYLSYNKYNYNWFKNKTKIEMALKQEILEEGWVKFTRWHCKEGYLDRWMGDCINNPNNPKKSQWQLNSFASYWRCNSGEWISDRDLGRSEVFALLQMGEEFTAKEIWDELLKREAVRRL